MKLQEVAIPYKLFVDLDGVLVDFEAKAKDVTGLNLSQVESGSAVKKEFWKKVAAYSNAGNPFFTDMAPMPDAMHLWNYVKKYHPTILSATGRHILNAEKEKREWVLQHLGHEAAQHAIFVQEAVSKAQYAAPNHVLIDDRPKAITPWIAAGGIGILHTSATQTIQELKKLGL